MAAWTLAFLSKDVSVDDLLAYLAKTYGASEIDDRHLKYQTHFHNIVFPSPSDQNLKRSMLLHENLAANADVLRVIEMEGLHDKNFVSKFVGGMHLMLGANAEGQQIMKSLVEHFGGAWLDTDCQDKCRFAEFEPKGLAPAVDANTVSQGLRP